MRLINFLMNSFVFVVVFCLSMFGSMAVYSAVSYQAKDSYSVISFSSKDDNVAYTDSVRYWAEDLGHGFTDVNKTGTKLRVANWLKWSWWKTAGSAVDMYVVDPVVKVIKPIFLPVSCADEIKTYYGADISDFMKSINRTDKTAMDFCTLARDYYGIGISFNANLEGEEDHIFVAKEEVELCADKIKLSSLSKEDLYNLADQYNYYYQILFKLHKYNRTNKEGVPLYQKWYNKYVFEDVAGRHLKSSVYSLYVIEIIALVYALFFIRQNPSHIVRNSDGFNEVHMPFRRIGFKKRKKKSK